ncbi:hypothetical protein EVJ58_g3861 [Rhodofomes roseus]|uniref:Uncharacterized protein n=1 Tax=Rhodofomes roseus TaxID=34475 RepID=A0A4Y9YN70_9APHY|nr:hypothetical protein EVJ58_g3861 [Rhodofomes roseus]
MDSLATDRICVIGAGAAGLITAHTLIQDGYQHVEVLTRDPTPGGIWSAGRVYDGLIINNIQGEYRFSNLDLPPPPLSSSGDIRLSGQDLQAYMETFVERFLPDCIRYNTEVLNIRATARGEDDLPHGDDHVWSVMVEDKTSKVIEVREYEKIVLCSGGNSEPHYPLGLSPKEARTNGFQGPVIHSCDYAARMHEFKTLNVPYDSPLRRAPKLFWSTHANNQGSGALGLFYRLVNEGAIDIIAPARVTSFSEDAQAVVLSDGRLVYADAVVLGTGYVSSWNKLFDDTALQELGLDCHAPPPATQYYRWDYTTLAESCPEPHPANKLVTSSIYRGLVPAKNILSRNFAINGAITTTNAGYAFETSANWIASYFRGDKFLQLPLTAEEAMASAAYNAAWLRRRYPNIHMSANDSVSSDFALWCWPQILDTLLEDMQLPIMRSGGNALTWPFQVIDVKEIAHLKEEREALRNATSTL